MLRSLAFGLFALSLTGCMTEAWMKEQVPNVPACRPLKTRPQTKLIDGKAFTLQRPNPLCMQKIGEPTCGYCRFTLDDKEVYVGDQWNHLLVVGKRKKKWSTLQEEGLLVPAETQAGIKAFMVNMCRITEQCGQEIDRLRVKLDSFDSVGDAFNRP